MSFNLYGIFAFLIALTAAFSYINFQFIRLPAAIGIMLIWLFCSLVLLGVGKVCPDIIKKPIDIIESLDFEILLMRIMLSFLLFAGAIHIDLNNLMKAIAPIASYSTFGVLLSTAFIGFIMFFIFQLFGLLIPYINH